MSDKRQQMLFCFSEATESRSKRVLVACEYSGRVRDAFIRKGHEAVSCDVLDTEAPGPHLKGDVRDYLGDGWDMMIAFPPCTHLCNSGAKWFAEKRKDGRQQEALEFVRLLMDSPIKSIAIENPIGIISTQIRQPDQIIHPWQFGHGEKKATCLWLKNLPNLLPEEVVEGRKAVMFNMADTKKRSKKRSLTYQGIANAMANQWG